MFSVRNNNLGIFGPYKDLVAALKDHENLVLVTEATIDIKCDLLPFYRLRKLLIIDLEESQHDFRLKWTAISSVSGAAACRIGNMMILLFK